MVVEIKLVGMPKYENVKTLIPTEFIIYFCRISFGFSIFYTTTEAQTNLVKSTIETASITQFIYF